MSESASLKQILTLQSWTSAAFPIGAFSCSHGLETAIQDGRVHDSDSCHDWIHAVATRGSGWNDSVIMAHAWRSTQLYLDSTGQDGGSRHQLTAVLERLNDLSLALQAGAERYRETTQLAAAFMRSAAAWPTGPRAAWPTSNQDRALPVVCGWLGARHALPLQLLVAAMLQSMTSNLAWIATRLVPLGQSSCLQLIADLEPVLEDVSYSACHASLDALGSDTLIADLDSLQHEQLTGRVCLT